MTGSTSVVVSSKNRRTGSTDVTGCIDVGNGSIDVGNGSIGVGNGSTNVAMVPSIL